MLKNIFLLSFATLFLTASSFAQNAATSQPWPKDWSAAVGKKLTLEGVALDAKSGALLRGDSSQEIWIDGLDSWPNGFYLGGDKGKRVRVTGTVIMRADLPAYVAKEGELPKSGIPVQRESDLKAARTRYFLKDATWVLAP